MIEVASFPEDLATWDRKTSRFYFELYGETRPRVDLAYAEVQPAGPEDGAPQTAAASLIYQYWWTIGHDGDPDEVRDFWSKLQDNPAARVYLYFPLNKGWRIKELVATVKYLQPYHERLSVWDKIANSFQNVVEPAVGGIGSVMSAVPALAGAGSVLSAIGKLQVNSIAPDAPGFEWAVTKVTTTWPGFGVVQGVMWRLPKKMFVDLGGRLTGSLALSFVPSRRQQGVVGPATATADDFADGAILAHAAVRGPQDEVWVPSQRSFVELKVAPQPNGGQAKPGPTSGAS